MPLNLRVLLLLNGIFFFTLSLGVAAGAKLNVSNLMVLSAFILGVILLLSTALLWKRDFQAQKSYTKKLLQVKSRPISMDDSFRACRKFGSQPPLVQDAKVESHAFSIDSLKRFAPPHPLVRVFVEHWSGPEALVREKQRSFLLEARQIISFVIEAGDVEIEPRSSKEGQRIDGIVHFISLQGSVE